MYGHNIKAMAGLVADRLSSYYHEGDLEIVEERIRLALHDYWTDRQAIVWDKDDVLRELPGLTDDQARRVLQKTVLAADANRGVSWDSFVNVGCRLYPDTPNMEEIRKAVEAYAASLLDMDKACEVFKTRDPDCLTDELSEREIAEIWHKYIRGGEAS